MTIRDPQQIAILLRRYEEQYFDARAALAQSQYRRAAFLSGQLLEDVLRFLVFENMPLLPAEIRASVQVRKREALNRRQPLALRFLIDVFREIPILDYLESATGRSAQAIRTLKLSRCVGIRNQATHSEIIAPDEARLLITTSEHLLAFAGANVDLGDPRLTPLRFKDADECLKLLLWQVWTYPDQGGSRSSWAVKESSVMRGDLERAHQRPGLGIALFTTELVAEVFGSAALSKIQACVDWGINQTQHSQHLLAERREDGITGKLTDELDLRHTVALAILMARFGSRETLQKYYLDLVLENICKDGGWPAVLGSNESDLPSTVYVVEFLSICSRSDEVEALEINRAIRLGQEWLILNALNEGGWATNIFRDKAWDGLWSTAYLIQRLVTTEVDDFAEWTDSIIQAFAYVLREAATLQYDNNRTQLRVEARVAAALSVSLRGNYLTPLLRDRTESWLNDWQIRALNTFRQVPVNEIDLGTATFAARGLLRHKEYPSLGDAILGTAI